MAEMADQQTRLAYLLDRAGIPPGRFRTQFSQRAKALGIPATISRRTAHRWMTVGGLTRLPQTESRRVLEDMFGESVESLLSGYLPEESLLPATITDARPVAATVITTTEMRSTPHDLREVIAMAADESARFGQHAEATNVGPRTLEQFHADLNRIATQYPSSDVFTKFVEARDLARRVFALLDGRQHPSQTIDLYLIAAGAAGIQANAAFDLGEFESASTQSRMAFLYAELAGHNGMRCWAKGMEALIAYWQDRPGLAANIAADAWRYRPESGTARVRLACIEARAHARLHDRDATVDALRRAEQAREAVAIDDMPAGMMSFPLSKQHLYVSTSFLWLGGPSSLAEAETNAASAISIYMSDPPDQRRQGEMSLARVDLALTRLARADIDGAAEQLNLVLEDAGARRTESIARRLRHVRSALERPHLQTSALATSMSERIGSSPVQPTPALPTLFQ